MKYRDQHACLTCGHFMPAPEREEEIIYRGRCQRGHEAPKAAAWNATREEAARAAEAWEAYVGGLPAVRAAGVCGEWASCGEPAAEAPPEPDPLIVSRHAGAVDWLRRRGLVAPVVAHATAEDVRGKRVYGVLPLHLAAAAADVYTIDLPGLPAEKRGQDLSPEEMDRYGAILRPYRVEAP